jgi:hypothetical protein
MAKSLCRACNTIFTSQTAFDLHRTGSFRKHSRRCMPEHKMQARGMTQNARGWWVAPTYDKVPPWVKVEQEETEEAAVAYR